MLAGSLGQFVKIRKHEIRHAAHVWGGSAVWRVKPSHKSLEIPLGRCHEAPGRICSMVSQPREACQALNRLDCDSLVQFRSESNRRSGPRKRIGNERSASVQERPNSVNLNICEQSQQHTQSVDPFRGLANPANRTLKQYRGRLDCPRRLIHSMFDTRRWEAPIEIPCQL